jgi:two-component system, chemotaxis family, protein-glutamate methylesterase/glutaminase
MTVFVPTMVSLDSHTAPAVRTLVVDDSVVVRTALSGRT